MTGPTFVFANAEAKKLSQVRLAVLLGSMSKLDAVTIELLHRGPVFGFESGVFAARAIAHDLSGEVVTFGRDTARCFGCGCVPVLGDRDFGQFRIWLAPEPTKTNEWLDDAENFDATARLLRNLVAGRAA